MATTVCLQPNCPRLAIKGGLCDTHQTDESPPDLTPIGHGAARMMDELSTTAERITWSALIVGVQDGNGDGYTHVFTRAPGPVKRHTYEDLPDRLRDLADQLAEPDHNPVQHWPKPLDEDADGA